MGFESEGDQWTVIGKGMPITHKPLRCTREHPATSMLGGHAWFHSLNALYFSEIDSVTDACSFGNKVGSEKGH